MDKKRDGMIDLRWWHVTRAVGIVVFLYGVFMDDSPERGTIILLGAGLAGFDKVSRADSPKGNGTDSDQNVK